MSEDGLSDFEDESQLTKDFEAAAKYLEGIVSTLDQATLLGLYGLYKQVTVGSCNVPKPGLFALQAKAKWNAWNELKGMDSDVAKQKYVDRITEFVPGWNAKPTQGSGTSKKASWVSVSTMVMDSTDEADPATKTSWDYVKDGDGASLEKSLCDVDDLDMLDDEGLSLLHWAADRGNVDILRMLLSAGADVNVLDEDGQTALHYAASVGHPECVRLLLESGADIKFRDQNGQSCSDVATSESIRGMLVLE